MNKYLFLFVILMSAMHGSAQDMTKFNLYKPGENANAELAKAVKEAKVADKYVLVQIGGNWCTWCARFNEFVKQDRSLDSLANSNYVVYHLNYSKENKNSDLLGKYQFPQRFGFPVFLVLNDKGELLHTQSSWYLESGKSYDKEKVKAFFADWGKKALDPAQYKEE